MHVFIIDVFLFFVESLRPHRVPSFSYNGVILNSLCERGVPYPQLVFFRRVKQFFYDKLKQS